MKTKIIILISALILLAIPLLKAGSSDCVTDPNNYDEFCMQDSCSEEVICTVPYCCCDDSPQNYSPKAPQECSQTGGIFISAWSEAYEQKYGGDKEHCPEFCGELNCTAAGLTCSEDCPVTPSELCEKYSWLSNTCPSGKECWKIKNVEDVFEQCSANEECEQGYDKTINNVEWCLKGHCVPKGIQLCEEQGHNCCSSGQIGIGNYYPDLYCSVGSCYDSCQTPTMCSSSDPDLIYNFDIRAVKDKPWLNLSWNNPCLGDTISTIITRKPSFSNDVVELANVTNYLDKDTEWDTCYIYHIKYITKYGVISNKAYESFCTGNKICENKGYNEFCVDNTRRKCNENNELINASVDLRNNILGDNKVDCSAFTIEQYDYEYSCTGPDSAGKTLCKPVKECESNTVGQPFGMYFDVSSCCEDAFCYFDYSDTVTGMCYNCSREMSCFNYSSELACSMDNCGVDKITGCSWLPVIPELGKGFCYEINYSGEDYCSLCGNNDDPFLNVNCTQNICSKLGSCYSNSNKCIACSEIDNSPNTGCSEYKTKEECQGNGPAHIDSNYYLIDGDDSCNLGVCRWIYSQNKCVKDGNLDYIPDCSNDICRRDVLRPVTEFSAPEYMGAQGNVIDFSLDSAIEFYACIGNSTNLYCNPNSTDFSNRIDNYQKIRINPVSEFSITNNGLYLFRFYSVDSYHNREKTREFFIYIDPNSPQINLNYNVINDTSTSDKSIVKFNIVSNEYADCYVNLTKYDFENNQIAEVGSWNTSLILSYDDSNYNLEDNVYTLNYVCKDSFNNSISNSILIPVDRVHGIFNTQPDSTIKGTQTVLSFETKDNSICNISGEGFVYRENKYSKTHSIPYFFSKNGTHYFSVNCVSQFIGQKDSTTIIFTVDNVPPNTTVIDKTTNEELNITGWVKDILEVKLECNDQTYDAPGAFGCKETKYCLGDLSYCSSADAMWKVADDTIRINQSFCYRSIDKGGNIENIQYKTLNIDLNDPIISISSPSSVSNVDYLTAEINASDFESGLASVSYLIMDSNGTIIVNKTYINITSGLSQKSEPVNETNLNLIDAHSYVWVVEATDVAGRTRKELKEIIYIKDTDLDGVSDSNDKFPNDPCSINEIGDNYGGLNCEFINYNLTEPRFGVANNFTFDIVLKTNKNASCRYNLGIPGTFNFMSKFDLTGGKVHKLLSFNEITDEFDHYLYVKCDDNQIPPDRNKIGKFRISVDTTAPKFVDNTPLAEPNPVIEILPGATTPNSFLIVRTDDRTICKYGYNTSDYNLMQKFDGFDNFSFAKEHTKTISLPSEKGDYLYSFICENAVGLRTNVTNLSIGVYLGTNLTIAINSPDPYMNVTEFYLNITTNKHTECWYSSNNKDYNKFDETGAQEHTQKLSLEEGKYTYYIKCFREDDNITKPISFTVDTTEPNIVYLDDNSIIANNPDESYYLDKLHAKWITKDDLSGIDYVEYKIINSIGDVVAKGINGGVKQKKVMV